MSEQPNAEPEPTVQPSSTPEGPQVVPAPSQPATEPYEDPGDPTAPPPTASSEPGTGDPEDGYDVHAATPNAAGPAGAAGGMGVSSERTGPAGDDPRGGGVEGTGSTGTAVYDTVGGQPTG